MRHLEEQVKILLVVISAFAQNRERNTLLHTSCSSLHNKIIQFCINEKNIKKFQKKNLHVLGGYLYKLDKVAPLITDPPPTSLTTLSKKN